MKKYKEVADATKEQRQRVTKWQTEEYEDYFWLLKRTTLVWALACGFEEIYRVRGLSEATVYVTTTLGSVNLEYLFWRVIGNVNGNYCGTAPNVSGIHERQCVGPYK
ncbi:hypothetical protein FQA39_LY00278 [Lamprigera yunnana]|nr:hypothetical protein FQA39_LY00278 [Lamprigera yunnana]